MTEALALGRHIRESGPDNADARGRILFFPPCPYMLAGGATREIDEDAQVGVHQHYFGESTILPASFAVEDIQAGQGEVMTYLDEMGIDPMVMTHALATPGRDLRAAARATQAIRIYFERHGIAPCRTAL